MAGIAGARWAYEVTRAGGLGFLGGEHALASANGYMQLCDQMEEFQNQHHHYQQQQQHYRGDDIRVRCNHVHSPPLCIGFISHSCLKEKRGWDRLESILIERRPKAVQFFAPYTVHHPEKSHIHNIRFAQSYGAKVVVQVDTLRDAQQALHAGVDALIVQRTETCDHDIRREYGINTTLALALEILAYRASEPTTSSRCPISNIPILAGGGIVDARSMAAMMAAGLDGVALGPRMFASYKAKGGNKGFRNALLDAANSSNDTIGNVTLDQIDRSYCSEQSWLEPYNSVGALGNDTTPQWDGRSNELNLKSERTDSGPTQSNHQAMLDDNPDIGPVLAGQDMGRICSLVREISQEAADILKNTPRRLFDQVEIDSSSDV
jgi:NAD(P)H-dependent flavin oxidoreductase YrpB (nitropropane dioxygenase family)